MRRMENGGTAQYTTALLCCSFLLRFSPAAVWGHPWARVLQDKLPLSWGPPEAAGDVYDPALGAHSPHLSVCRAVSHTFFPHSLLAVCALFWNLFPLRCHSLAVGLSHALQWVGWSCLPGLPWHLQPDTDTSLQPSSIKALPHTPRTPRYGTWEW